MLLSLPPLLSLLAWIWRCSGGDAMRVMWNGMGNEIVGCG